MYHRNVDKKQFRNFEKVFQNDNITINKRNFKMTGDFCFSFISAV